MVYAVCPTDVVNAPIERVWSLLTDPAGWGDFWDARVLDIEPAGPAAAGQRILLRSGPWPARFRLTFTFTKVDPANHTLDLDIRLPFGVVNDEHLACAAIDDVTCRVTYGCNFTLPAGWRGVLLRLLSRRFEAGPADSLARLKRAAERP
jgi:uncharacterized protein YndB with AHSA1/START domain